MTKIFDIPQTRNRLRIVAHRGTTVFAPENTIASFEYAGEHKAWAIETDLRLTADQHIVCIHNAEIDTKYNGVGKVADMTLSELRALTAVDDGFGLPEEKLKMATLEEYLDICMHYGAVPFIEIKDDVVEMTVAVLKKREMLAYSVISSSNFEHLRDTRRLTKDVFIHHIFSQTEYAPELARLGNSGLAYNYKNLDDVPNGLIEEMHGMGLKICFRAGDTPETVARMLDMGLDYIPSNRIYSI